MAPLIIEDELDDRELTSRGQDIVGLAQEQLLLGQIEAVQDVAHRDQICLRQLLVGEEIAAADLDAIGDPETRRGFLRKRFEHRHVVADAPHARMVQRHHRGERRPRAADIQQEPVLRKIEALRERDEGADLDARHRLGELSQPLGLIVDRRERLLPRRLDFVLRLARPQPLLQIPPEAILPIVDHLEKPADVLRLSLDEECPRLRRVLIFRPEPRPFAHEEAEREKCVQEIEQGPSMKPERGTNLLGGSGAVVEQREKPELGRGKQRLRRPEAEADLHDVRGIELFGR